MFILTLTYTAPIEVIDELIPAHRVYLDENYALGKFICSGAQIPRTGGIIICNAANKTEVTEIIARDPFYTQGAANYQVTEFTPTKYTDEFKPFIKF